MSQIALMIADIVCVCSLGLGLRQDVSYHTPYGHTVYGMVGITIFPSETKTPRTGYTAIRHTSAAGHEGGQRRQNPTWYHRLAATSRSLALLSLLSTLYTACGEGEDKEGWYGHYFIADADSNRFKFSARHVNGFAFLILEPDCH